MKKVAIISGWVGNPPDYVNQARANHSLYATKHGYSYVWFEEDQIVDLMGGQPMTAASIWWMKPYLIQHTLNLGFDAVFWSDTDSLFVNLDVSLRDLVLSPASFIFTGDAWDLCSAGHLWFKDSEFTRKFLKRWLQWENVIVDSIGSTHQNHDGSLGDQPALNILLRGGVNAKFVDALLLFNEVNGYKGNSSKKHRWFRWTHSPTSKLGVKRAQNMIHPDFRSECMVVPQNRLNAYPFTLLPAIRATRKSPIVHFPGQHKDKMRKYL